MARTIIGLTPSLHPPLESRDERQGENVILYQFKKLSDTHTKTPFQMGKDWVVSSSRRRTLYGPSIQFMNKVEGVARE